MKKTRYRKQDLITLGVLLVLGAAACIVLLLAPPGSPHAKWLPKCLFHQLTGLYCPGCGATRALSALLHGNLKASLHNNALLIPLGATLFVLIAKPEISLKRPVAFAIVAIVLSFTVLRNIPVAPFTYLAPVPLPQTRNSSEEPGADNRCQTDQHKRGGQKEKPEPAEHQGTFCGADGSQLLFPSVLRDLRTFLPADVSASPVVPTCGLYHLIDPLNAAMTAAPIRSADTMTETMTGKNTPQPMRQSCQNVTDPQSMLSYGDAF